MDKNKSQIILLDKNGLDTVAKVLSSGCWTLSDAGSLDVSGNIEEPSTSNSQGGAPRLTLAQGNTRPVTQVSATGGSANKVSAVPNVREQSKVGVRDTLHLTTITELGKRLVAAAKVGNIALVRKLMAVGAPFISDGPIGMTPLHFAAQNGHYEICERLLCAGLNKDVRNKVEKTALHLAAMEGHSEITSLLVMSEADINARDMLKMTALHWACDRGHAGIVKQLLKHSAKVDILNKFQKTPLHLAEENGHKQIISLLQGGLTHDDGEDAVAVDSISLDMIHDPAVCKTEEVCTEEDAFSEEEISQEKVEHCVAGEVKEETISSFDSDLQHSIITDDDGEDQNTSVLATLAELAEVTSRGGGGESCVADMSSVAALELLKAQAALMPIDDSSALVTSAVAHGQTLQLTEAGRQALKLIKQEPLLLPSSPLLQENNEEIDSENVRPSSSESIVCSTQQSESASAAACLPALLASSIDKSDVDGTCEDQEEEVMQVITLSPEQYAALTGERNGPIILQVMQSEEALNDLDTGQGQPLPKRQKVMQLVTKTGDVPLSHGQAIARVTGEVLSVDLSGTSTL